MSQSVAGGTLYLVFFGILSKLLGFFREMLTAALFGTSWRMDSVSIVIDPIGLIAALLSGASARILIPMYIEMRRESPRKAGEFAWSVLLVISSVYFGIGILLLLFPEGVVKIFAPGFSKEMVEYSARKLRYLAFLPIVLAGQQILTAILRSQRKFREVALSGALFNVFTIPVIYAFAPVLSEASYILAWMIGQTFVGLALLIQSRRFLKPTLHIPRKEMREFFRGVVPISLATSLAAVNNVVDKAFVSLLPAGRVASLKYSQILIWFVNAVIGYFILASYTELSERSVLGDFEGTQERMRKTIQSSLNVAIPTAAWLATMSERVVSLVYQRGAFNERSTELVSAALVGYSLLVVLAPVRTVMTDYLVLKKRYSLITALSFSSVGLNALLDWIFLKPFQHAGIALSTSVVVFVLTVITGIILRRYGLRVIPWKRILHSSVLSSPIVVLALLTSGVIRMVVVNSVFVVVFFLSARREIRAVYTKTLDFLRRMIG